jgi:hypothetical protein
MNEPFPPQSAGEGVASTIVHLAVLSGCRMNLIFQRARRESSGISCSLKW